MGSSSSSTSGDVTSAAAMASRFLHPPESAEAGVAEVSNPARPSIISCASGLLLFLQRQALPMAA